MAYLGTIGSMVKVACPSAESSDTERPAEVRELPNGSRLVFEAPRSRRQWGVKMRGLTPREVATWQGFVHRVPSQPPWVWISEYAKKHNVLEPRDSLLSAGTIAGPGIVSNAPVALEGGGTSLSSIVILEDRKSVGIAYDAAKHAYRKIPVVSGVPVTASAWVNSTGVALMDVYFMDVAGAEISRSTARLTTGHANKRIVVEGVIPPTGAVSCEVKFNNCRLIAQPAVSFTATVQDWGIGDGCYSAYFSDISTDLLAANAYGTYQDPSLTIIELEV